MLLYVLVPLFSCLQGWLTEQPCKHTHGYKPYKWRQEDSNWKDFMCVLSRKPTFADVPACVLDGGVAIDVGKQAETEAIFVVGGVREAVHQDAA